MRVGSLFSGCLGLDLGLEAAGWEVAWTCESNEACRRVIARQRPGLTCYPDVREIDGGTPRVDIIAGGFPCTDLSLAGRGAGLAGEHSGLWFPMADAIRLLRPRFVLVENVPGLAAKTGARPGESALGTVIADLAEAGYVGSAVRIRASDVMAPHKRERIFLLAADSSCQRRREKPGSAPRDEIPDGGWRAEGDHEPRGTGSSRLRPTTAPDAGSARLQWWRGADEGATDGGGRDGIAAASGHRSPASDSAGPRREGAGEPGVLGAEDGAEAWWPEEPLGDHAARASADAGGEGPEGAAHGGPAGGTVSRIGPEWGRYEPAVRRWESILGRYAPRPTDDRGRLEPAFVEWMLGFPNGWTEGESRTARLRMLGNAVQVQVAEICGHVMKGVANGQQHDAG